MRFFEIAQPARRVVATKRFEKTFIEFSKKYAGLKETLRDFVDFRLIHRPDEPFSPKDAAFSPSSSLAGFRHLHMVHGKAILVYYITAANLCLCCMLDHTETEGKRVNSLVTYLKSLEPSSFSSIETSEEKPELSSEQINDLRSLIYDMAVQDREILMAAVNGDFSDLMEFMRLVIDNSENDQTIVDSMGGSDALRKFIQDVLKQTSPK